ncbi:MAG: single-stranded DNA-binding protein [Candidatus Pacebacteria bacterium]|nr:single-stranded DNA-binding protein [Candidatus Paceibacterota bacterium]
MSVRSLNKVMLIGNLTRDPNLRFTPNGTAVCSFGLATNRSWTSNDSGEKQERVDFHNVVAWGKLAEICGQLLHKGDKTYVEGRIQNRDWKTEEGAERRITEVVIDNMMLLSSRGGYVADNVEGEEQADKKSKSKTKAKKDEEEFDSEVEEIAPSTEGEEVEDVSDDIPF